MEQAPRPESQSPTLAAWANRSQAIPGFRPSSCFVTVFSEDYHLLSLCAFVKNSLSAKIPIDHQWPDSESELNVGMDFFLARGESHTPHADVL